MGAGGGAFSPELFVRGRALFLDLDDLVDGCVDSIEVRPELRPAEAPKGDVAGGERDCPVGGPYIRRKRSRQYYRFGDKATVSYFNGREDQR